MAEKELLDETRLRYSDEDQVEFFRALNDIVCKYKQETGYSQVQQVVQRELVIANKTGKPYDLISMEASTGIPRETIRRTMDTLVEMGTHHRVLEGKRVIVTCTPEAQANLRPLAEDFMDIMGEVFDRIRARRSARLNASAAE